MDSPNGDTLVPESNGVEGGRDATADLPDRYLIRTKGEVRELLCRESPTVAVRVDRGVTFPAGAARKASPGTIFLDGAAEGGPFLDVEKAVFNLDHHDGCVRSFTLSTCEQAMVLVRKGMDLQSRDWTILANDPDLDTVLAIWVFLNHLRLNGTSAEIRRNVMPLIRLQGTIDAHGLKMEDFCGFPAEFEKAVFADLEQLRQKEVSLKKDGKWQETDFLTYTADLLRAIDGLVYSSYHFEGVLEIEELARAEISENRLAIVCKAPAGIYEVEQHLRELHGKRLGIIILQKDPRTYTLRQVDAFLPANLANAYELLNLKDSEAGGRSSGNRWGGSGEIGGSPRKTGTSLPPQEIADTIARAYRKATTAQRLSTLTVSLLGTTAVMLAALVSAVAVGWWREPDREITEHLRSSAGVYTSILAGLTALLALVAVRSGRRLFGWRIPTSYDWLLLLPAALIGGLAGGAWVFEPLVSGGGSIARSDLIVALILPATVEVLFRGLMHGTLATQYRRQYAGGRWRLSWPVIVTSIVYCLWTAIPILPLYSHNAGLTAAGALLFGISSGMARQRSESIFPSIALHWSCLVLVVVKAAYGL